MGNTILTCYIVDDSSIQRLSLTNMIENHPNLRVIGEYSNAIETKAALKNEKVDVIFIDVDLPVINGFELLDDISDRPVVIFISTETKHAFKAFEYGATDYLQKPINKERFNLAISRSLIAYKVKNDISTDKGEFIFVKSNLKKRKIYLNNLIYLQALGDYVKLFTHDDKVIVLSTMKNFENELPKDSFLRIHKSYIVNLHKVKKFNSKMVEINDMTLPLSRNRKKDLVNALSR